MVYKAWCIQIASVASEDEDPLLRVHSINEK